MAPVLFRIPWINWDVPGYGMALMLGFLASVIWAARRAAKSGGNPDVVLNCAFIALLGGVGGARFMHVVDYWEYFTHYPTPMARLMAILDLRQGGLEVYGGVITAMVLAIFYLAVRRYSVRWYMDILAPSLALGMGLGRIGCFLNGCCWGTVSDVPWAVRFPFGSNAMVEQWYDGEPGMDLPKELIRLPSSGMDLDGRAASPIPREVLWMTPADVARVEAVAKRVAELEAQAAVAKTSAERQKILQMRQGLGGGCRAATLNSFGIVYAAMRTHGLSLSEIQALARKYPSQPVHPAQVYSTIMLVLLALLLNAIYWRRTRDGQVMCVLLLIEPWSRYILELLRADNPIDTLGFTISQKLAIGLSALGLIGLFALSRMSPRSPRAKLWEPQEEAAKPGKGDAPRGARKSAGKA